MTDFQKPATDFHQPLTDEDAGSPVSLPIHQVVHSLAVGGAEVLAVRLAEGLLPRYSSRVICLDEAGPLEERVAAAGLRVEVVGRGPGWDRECARRM
ncbi:MAG: hypothetical protein GYA33_05755, partial [Thermogutta sp.]|nr:hypothetical protein [Thermogutta sp.]